MSLIALFINLLLAGLLTAALVMGWRLNRRLSVLRDSHDGFEAAVRDLNTAAARAEMGLADLRAATDEATDLLADRIEKGRALVAQLERLTQTSRVPSEPAAATSDAVVERRLGALLAAARGARSDRLGPRRPIAERDTDVAPALARADFAVQLEARRAATRPRPSEDDLFDDEPLVLKAAMGGRR